MNYTVIRTSDDHLEHHGILGMKWGVWNDETRARRQGKRKNRIQRGTEQHQERIRKNKERWNNPKLKAAAKTGTAVVASLLAAYGLIKLDKALSEYSSGKGQSKYKIGMSADEFNKAMSNIKAERDQVSRWANNLRSVEGQMRKDRFSMDLSNYTMSDLKKLDLY